MSERSHPDRPEAIRIDGRELPPAVPALDGSGAVDQSALRRLEH